MVTNHINVAPPFHCHLGEKTGEDCSVILTEQYFTDLYRKASRFRIVSNAEKTKVRELHFVLFRVADLWRFNLDRIIVSVIHLMLLFEYPDNLTFYFSCERLSLDRELFFCAKLLRIGETASDRYACGRGLQPWASHFYRASKNGYPGFIRACTLAFFSL